MKFTIDTKALLTVFLLGIIAGGSLAIALNISHDRIALYIAALCIFHFLEYFMISLQHPSLVNYECTHFCVMFRCCYFLPF